MSLIFTIRPLHDISLQPIVIRASGFWEELKVTALVSRYVTSVYGEVESLRDGNSLFYYRYNNDKQQWLVELEVKQDSA